jgi:membrane protease YdiL (CAAX protease family)
MQVPTPSIDLPALLLQSEEVASGDGIAAIVVGACAGLAAAIVLRFGLWRIPVERRGRTPNDPLIWMLAASLVYLSGAFGVLASHVSADEAYARLATGFTGNLVQFGIGLVVLLQLSRPPAAPATPVRPSLIAGAVAFLLVLPITSAASIALNEILSALGAPRAPQTSHETLRILVERKDSLLTLLTLAHVTLLVPAAEELLWRGIIQPAMRAAVPARTALAGWLAILGTTLLFVLVHWNSIVPEGRATGFTIIALLALGLGILRERTGSLIAPFALHALFNAANVAIALLQNPVSSSQS